MNHNIGKALKTARENKGLTQEQVGTCLSQTAQSISSYERGITQPDYQTFIQLLDLYRVSADDLLGLPCHNIVRLVNISEKQEECIISTIASFLSKL